MKSVFDHRNDLRTTYGRSLRIISNFKEGELVDPQRFRYLISIFTANRTNINLYLVRMKAWGFIEETQEGKIKILTLNPKVQESPVF